MWNIQESFMKQLSILVYQVTALLKLEFACIKSKRSRQVKLSYLMRKALDIIQWELICMNQNMIISRLEGRCWYTKDRKINPSCYVGEQLIPSVTKKKTRKSVNSSKCKFRMEYANKSDAPDGAMLIMTKMIIYTGRKIYLV